MKYLIKSNLITIIAKLQWLLRSYMHSARTADRCLLRLGPVMRAATYSLNFVPGRKAPHCH